MAELQSLCEKTALSRGERVSRSGVFISRNVTGEGSLPLPTKVIPFVNQPSSIGDRKSSLSNPKLRRRSTQPLDNAALPQGHHNLKQARGHCLTGERHASSVNQQARFDTFLFCQSAQASLCSREVKGFDSASRVPSSSSSSGNLASFQNFFFASGSYSNSSLKKARPDWEKSLMLRARVCSRRAETSKRCFPSAERFLPKPGRLQLLFSQPQKVLRGEMPQVLTVHPGKLFRVEDGIRFGNGRELELAAPSPRV